MKRLACAVGKWAILVGVGAIGAAVTASATWDAEPRHAAAADTAWIVLRGDTAASHCIAEDDRLLELVPVEEVYLPEPRVRLDDGTPVGEAVGIDSVGPELVVRLGGTVGLLGDEFSLAACGSPTHRWP
jgi:hypothetical protein